MMLDLTAALVTAPLFLILGGLAGFVVGRRWHRV